MIMVLNLDDIEIRETDFLCENRILLRFKNLHKGNILSIYEKEVVCHPFVNSDLDLNLDEFERIKEIETK